MKGLFLADFLTVLKLYNYKLLSEFAELNILEPFYTVN